MNVAHVAAARSRTMNVAHVANGRHLMRRHLQRQALVCENVRERKLEATDITEHVGDHLLVVLRVPTATCYVHPTMRHLAPQSVGLPIVVFRIPS